MSRQVDQQSREIERIWNLERHFTQPKYLGILRRLQSKWKCYLYFFKVIRVSRSVTRKMQALFKRNRLKLNTILDLFDMRSSNMRIYLLESQIPVFKQIMLPYFGSFKRLMSRLFRCEQYRVYRTPNPEAVRFTDSSAFSLLNFQKLDNFIVKKVSPNLETDKMKFRWLLFNKERTDRYHKIYNNIYSPPFVNDFLKNDYERVLHKNYQHDSNYHCLYYFEPADLAEYYLFMNWTQNFNKLKYHTVIYNTYRRYCAQVQNDPLDAKIDPHDRHIRKSIRTSFDRNVKEEEFKSFLMRNNPHLRDRLILGSYFEPFFSVYPLDSFMDYTQFVFWPASVIKRISAIVIIQTCWRRYLTRKRRKVPIMEFLCTKRFATLAKYAYIKLKFKRRVEMLGYLKFFTGQIQSRKPYCQEVKDSKGKVTQPANYELVMDELSFKLMMEMTTEQIANNTRYTEQKFLMLLEQGQRFKYYMLPKFNNDEARNDNSILPSWVDVPMLNIATKMYDTDDPSNLRLNKNKGDADPQTQRLNRKQHRADKPEYKTKLAKSSAYSDALAKSKLYSKTFSLNLNVGAKTMDYSKVSSRIKNMNTRTNKEQDSAELTQFANRIIDEQEENFNCNEEDNLNGHSKSSSKLPDQDILHGHSSDGDGDGNSDGDGEGAKSLIPERQHSYPNLYEIIDQPVLSDNMIKTLKVKDHNYKFINEDYDENGRTEVRLGLDLLGYDKYSLFKPRPASLKELILNHLDCKIYRLQKYFEENSNKEERMVVIPVDNWTDGMSLILAVFLYSYTDCKFLRMQFRNTLTYADYQEQTANNLAYFGIPRYPIFTDHFNSKIFNDSVYYDFISLTYNNIERNIIHLNVDELFTKLSEVEKLKIKNCKLYNDMRKQEIAIAFERVNKRILHELNLNKGKIESLKPAKLMASDPAHHKNNLANVKDFGSNLDRMEVSKTLRKDFVNELLENKDKLDYINRRKTVQLIQDPTFKNKVANKLANEKLQKALELKQQTKMLTNQIETTQRTERRGKMERIDQINAVREVLHMKKADVSCSVNFGQRINKLSKNIGEIEYKHRFDAEYKETQGKIHSYRESLNDDSRHYRTIANSNAQRKSEEYQSYKESLATEYLKVKYESTKQSVLKTQMQRTMRQPDMLLASLDESIKRTEFKNIQLDRIQPVIRVDVPWEVREALALKEQQRKQQAEMLEVEQKERELRAQQFLEANKKIYNKDKQKVKDQMKKDLLKPKYRKKKY